MRSRILLSLVLLLTIISCASKKELSEKTETTERIQASSVSFNQQQYYDSLLSHMTISIDRVIIQSGERLATVFPCDSVDFARDHASPRNTTIVAEGVKLDKTVSSQKSGSAKQSNQDDAVIYRDMTHKIKKESATKPDTSFCIVVPLVLGVILAGAVFFLFKWISKTNPFINLLRKFREN